MAFFLKAQPKAKSFYLRNLEKLCIIHQHHCLSGQMFIPHTQTFRRYIYLRTEILYTVFALCKMSTKQNDKGPKQISEIKYLDTKTTLGNAFAIHGIFVGKI